MLSADLCNKLNLMKSTNLRKNASLIFDEMKIKSELVLSKRAEKLVGFCEMGEINDEIEKFSKAIESQAATEKLGNLGVIETLQYT